MKKLKKRLALRPETLSNLTAPRGGIPFSNEYCDSGDAQCPTTFGYPSCNATVCINDSCPQNGCGPK